MQNKTITILKGKAFNNFINSLKADDTKKEYQRVLLEYAKWRKVDSLDHLLKGDTTELKDHITEYITFLKNKNLRAGSRNIAVAALKHFYSQNDVTLNWDIIRKFIGQDKTRNVDREYSYDEIAKLIDCADLKYKTIILLMFSSTLRLGALHMMQYGDLEKMKKYDIYKVTVYARTRSAYDTFCSPECYRAIQEYIGLRQRFGEVLRKDSPLFRNDFDPNDLQQVKNARPLSYDAIKSKLRQILIRSGVVAYQKLSKENPAGRRRNEVMMSHGLRKAGYTAMARSRMDAEVRELLVGHTIGVRATYLKYSTEDLLNEYLRAVDNLTVDASNRLLAQVDEYKHQQLEINSLKKQLAEIQNAVVGMVQYQELSGEDVYDAAFPEQKESTTMKDIVKQTVTSKDDIKDFNRNLKGVSKEIMRKTSRKK
jgi:integrase